MRRFNEILKIQWRIRGIAILRDFPETSFHTFSAPWHGGCKRPWNKRATANSRLRRFAFYVIFSLPNFTDLLEHAYWDATFLFRACATDLVLRDTLLTRLFYATRIVNCHVRLRWHVCVQGVRSYTPCVSDIHEYCFSVWSLLRHSRSTRIATSSRDICEWRIKKLNTRTIKISLWCFDAYEW